MGFERLSPGTVEWEAYYANHLFRYQFALNNLKEDRKIKILDAACGVGFGSHFLAVNGIKEITGIDRNEEALKLANEKFFHKAISYIQDDCHTLSKASEFGLYDAIVSMETLEHMPQPDAFIKSCYSSLEKGGLLIVSTPNAAITSPDGEINWEFHEKEYTADELVKILSDHGFQNIRLFGQGYSAIGKLRDQIRSELNIINSNPFARLGRFIQKLLKGYTSKAVLPEQIEDFEISLPGDFIAKKPFVLIAVCNK